MLVGFSYETELSDEINLYVMPHVEIFLLPLNNAFKIILTNESSNEKQPGFLPLTPVLTLW